MACLGMVQFWGVQRELQTLPERLESQLSAKQGELNQMIKLEMMYLGLQDLKSIEPAENLTVTVDH